MRKAICTFLILFLFQSAWAEEEEKPTRAKKPTKAMKALKKNSVKKTLTPAKKKQSSNQSAVIKVEGAMIYENASFDAAVITYLPIGKKVTISKKTYGPFYRIKVKKGVIGYISDVDLEIKAGSGKSKDGDPKTQMLAEQEKTENAESQGGEEFTRSKKPLEEATVMGLGVTLLNYSEHIFGQNPSANMTMYGLKLTGTDLMVPTLMDIGISFALSPPSYYSSGSEAAPSGYLIIADSLLVMPFMGGEDLIAYLGFGPFLNYSSIKIVLANQLLKMDLLKLGAEGMIGVGFRTGTAVIKIEGKYFYDSESYYAGTLGIQLSY